MSDWLKNILNKVKDLDVSVDTYKEETGNQSMPSLAYLNRAKKFIEKSSYLDAKKVLEQALEINPKDAIIYKYIGICEEKMGNFDSAIEAYKISASINPNDKNIWHKLGIVEVTIKNYESAEKSFEQADKVTPINTDIYTGWGMSLYKQTKYAQAHEKFIKAIKINRYNFAAMLLSAILEIQLEMFDDAEKKLIFLIGVNSNESCTYEYANLNFIRGNYDDAIKYAKQSIEHNPHMLPAYLLIGKIYSMKFDYENSIKYFEMAKEKEMQSVRLYIEWGNALVRLYRFCEAKEIYIKVLVEDIDCIEAQAGMAICNAEAGDFTRAKECIDFVESKNPEDLFLKEAKGLRSLCIGDVEEAIACFKAVLNKDSQRIYNYFRLAKCYEKSNNNDMVKDSYEKLTKFNPNFALGYVEYAKYLITLSDFKDAQRKLRKALKIDGKNQEILNLLFYVTYTLVKENICEYNIKEAILIADDIQDFQYPEFRSDLEVLLKNIQESK